MAWRTHLERPAERELAKLGNQSQLQIIKKLKWFREHFEETHHRILHADLSEYFKLRIGNWRAMYTIDYTSQLIRIWHIDNRDKIYKRKS